MLRNEEVVAYGLGDKKSNKSCSYRLITKGGNVNVNEL